jgi:hypothetical protein
MLEREMWTASYVEPRLIECLILIPPFQRVRSLQPLPKSSQQISKLADEFQRMFTHSVLHRVAKISVCFQLPNIVGNSTQRGRGMIQAGHTSDV